MTRAQRARRIAATAAAGGGAGVGALGLGYALLLLQARLARRIVGKPFDDAPEDSGIYRPDTPGPEAAPEDGLELVVLGDSLAAGLGADHGPETMGARLAEEVASLAARSVRLTNVAEVGAEASWLGGQVASALDLVEHPQVAVVTVGGNDVTHRVDRAASVRDLAAAVRRLRIAGAEVVVGTCPDLGTLRPIAQPLRSLTRRWSRDLAAAQTVAVVEAGGRTVSLGDLLGPEFFARPEVMFSADRFHPSAAGYARAADALLPSVCAAFDLWPGEVDREPDRLRGEGVRPVAVAAGRAADHPGTEVSGAPVGPRRGRRMLATVLRRRRPDGPPGSDADLDDRDPDRGLEFQGRRA